jgi:hypothetical protein
MLPALSVPQHALSRGAACRAPTRFFPADAFQGHAFHAVGVTNVGFMPTLPLVTASLTIGLTIGLNKKISPWYTSKNLVPVLQW